MVQKELIGHGQEGNLPRTLTQKSLRKKGGTTKNPTQEAKGSRQSTTKTCKNLLNANKRDRV